MKAPGRWRLGGLVGMKGLGELDQVRCVHQLHVEVGPGGLEALVDEVALAALEVVAGRLSGNPGENRAVLRAALRQGLKRFIVGFDVCGAASFCRETSRFDPWA